MDKVEKQELVDRFYAGETIISLSEEYNMTWSGMYQIIDGVLPCIKELTKDEELDIVELYTSGKSSTKISEKYKINHKLVNRVLDKYGIKRIRNGVRKWSLKEDYFDIIDSQNKAYVLGLLYADGYNDIGKSTVRLQLRYDDVEILEKINKELGSNRPLKFIKCSDHVASNGYISKDMYSLEVYGSHICNSLKEQGVVQNKSLILEFPSFDDESLYRHFIRGYFDGDGSFTYHKLKKNNRSQGLITITSTLNFCQKCLDIIRSNVNIGGSIFDASCHNGVTKVISIFGNIQCKNFLDWLYYDADLYLNRKYEKYINAYYQNVA